MTPKELKRLSRSDLLEMMLEVTQENAKLRKDNEILRGKLNDRTLTVEKCGSLAEASLQLSDVFKTAQAACDLYAENIQKRFGSLDEKCRKKEQESEAKCEAMLKQAKLQAQRILEDAKRASQEKEASYAWLTELMDGGQK